MKRTLLLVAIFTASSLYAKNEIDELIPLYVERGDALRESQHAKAALYYLREAHRLKPDDTTITFDLANTLNIANENEEALKYYYRLLQIYPTHKVILYNTAYTLKKMNRVQDAMLFYEAAIEQDENYPEARFSRSLAYLVNGDFERGWQEYEWRWNRPDYPDERRFENVRIWDGISDLHGKVVYLHSEQGLGDTFQFVRYARILKEKGAIIVLAVQAPLRDIIAQCPYIDRVVAMNEQPVRMDFHVPLMSLPKILGTRMDTVPNEVPYLYAKPELIEEWKQQLSHDHNFRVGICWQGNPNYRTPALRAVVAAKSLPAQLLAPLTHLPGVSVYSLQRETGVQQVDELAYDFRLIKFDGDFDQSHGRFMDTAAVMKNLDLIITVDTSIAHLAAGLGVPTWVFIPDPGDWRWLLSRADTPWYPCMRLFRQKTSGDWATVVQEVTNELAKAVVEKGTISAQQMERTRKEIDELFNEAHALESQLKKTRNRIDDAFIPWH